MRKLASLYLAFLLAFSIVGLIGCGDDETVTSGGPSVASIYPKNGADDVPSTSGIMVTFDREISPPSPGNLSFTPGVAGTVTYDSGSYTLTFDPSADMGIGTDYSLTISGVTDVEGNSMNPVTTKFSTIGPDTERPEITFTSPHSGSKDIGHDEDLTFTFSEPIDRAKFRSAIFFTPEIDLKQEEWLIEWGFGDEEQATISPPPSVYAYPLNKACTLLLSKGNLTDTSGNPLLIDHKLEFKTLRYPIMDIANPFYTVSKQPQLWLYRLGNWNNKWVVMWGGTVTRGGPSGSSPAGTITASADGYILDTVERFWTHVTQAFTVNVSNGNGNTLTYTSATADSDDHFTLIFASTSKYVTFDLRSSSGTTPPAFVHIGKLNENPAKTPFVMRNKDLR